MRGFKEQISRLDPSTFRSGIVEFWDEDEAELTARKRPRKVLSTDFMTKLNPLRHTTHYIIFLRIPFL